VPWILLIAEPEIRMINAIPVISTR